MKRYMQLRSSSQGSSRDPLPSAASIARSVLVDGDIPSAQPLDHGQSSSSERGIPSSLENEPPSSRSSVPYPDLHGASLASAPFELPPLDSFLDGAANDNTGPDPNADQEQSARSEDLEDVVQQLLASLEDRNKIREEFARLDRQLDQQRLAHAFIRATKDLEQNLPSKAREWVTYAEEITERLNDPDNQARCIYWFGRIDWYEGRETDAYWRFMEASKKLTRGCEEMRRIPMYMEWLRPGIERDKRRAKLARHGFYPPHEKQPTRVSRKKVQGSSLPDSICYNRYSNPGLKRKRENMEPDVAVALDLRRRAGKKREPRSRTVMTFESDRHIHPGEETRVVRPQLHHLAYDFSWTKPQQLSYHPPFRKDFNFSKYPRGRAKRWRSHKVFAEQPWEDKCSKRTKAAGKTDVTMKMLAEELDPVSYQALRYGYRTPRL